MTIQELIDRAFARSGATSFRHLCRIMDVPQAAAQRWHLGHTLPSDENMIRLADCAHFDRVEALLLLSSLRTEGEARATYEALLQQRKDRAA
jgi:hypothetical protein